MPISVLFNPFSGRINAIGSVQLEVTVSERHTMRSQVTQDPVEDGATITDHIYLEPDRITLEGMVSDTPVALFGGLLTGGFGAYRSLSTFEALRQIRDQRLLVTVVTAYRIYTDMAMQTLDIPRDAATGQSIRFQCELIKVIKAASETVEVPEDELPARDDQPPAVGGDAEGSIQDQATDQRDLGARTTREATESEEDATQGQATPLRRILEGVGVQF